MTEPTIGPASPPRRGRPRREWALLAVVVVAAGVGGWAVTIAQSAMNGAVRVPSFMIIGIPAAGYAVILLSRGIPLADVGHRLGLGRGRRSGYVLALPLIAGALLIGYVLAAVLYPEMISRTGRGVEAYAGMPPGVATLVFAVINEGICVAMGEELLFRGLLLGWTVRRFGFGPGNTIAALAFTAVHLPLVAAGIPLPVMAFVLVFALVAGWLRHRSGSIWPGWIAHTVVNAVSKTPF